MIKKIKSGDFSAADYLAQDAGGESVSSTVADIIASVRARGDAALHDFSKRFDGCELTSFEVTDVEVERAVKTVGPEFIAIMERAAANIEAFHRQQVKTGFMMNTENGVTLGQRILPIARVGLYIPGGTASYPSSVLMNCIPAKIAGVRDIIMTTPPTRKGSVNAGILAAAKISGVDRIYKIGGAQAVAAMAFGTESVQKVDKIVGPGNAYVAEAKRQVFGVVGIDMIAGPSDILVIADGTAQARLVAADMLSQCEHGELSRAVLITTSAELAEMVLLEIGVQLETLPRGELTRAAVDNNSVIIVAESLDEAFEISNELAPEHLEIFLDSPFDWLDRVQNAGSVFLGKNTPEALGDYYAGVNHTLPTSGTARFSSPLSVDDFVKKSSFTYYTEDALVSAASDVALFAEKEGLYAHAQSVLKRSCFS